MECATCAYLSAGHLDISFHLIIDRKSVYILYTAELWRESDTGHLKLLCRRCNGGVKFALENDSKANLRFAALQSDTGKRLLQVWTSHASSRL